CAVRAAFDLESRSHDVSGGPGPAEAVDAGRLLDVCHLCGADGGGPTRTAPGAVSEQMEIVAGRRVHRAARVYSDALQGLGRAVRSGEPAVPVCALRQRCGHGLSVSDTDE